MSIRALALFSAAVFVAAAPGQQPGYDHDYEEQPKYYGSGYQKPGYAHDGHTRHVYKPNAAISSSAAPTPSSSTGQPTSTTTAAYVKGAAFDRITIIYLETTPYDDAVSNGSTTRYKVLLLLTSDSGLSGFDPARDPLD